MTPMVMILKVSLLGDCSNDVLKVIMMMFITTEEEKRLGAKSEHDDGVND